MKSITELYLIGKGPSSSHTMGPEKAAKLFLAEHPEAERFEVRLYGSLALTGTGHGTGAVGDARKGTDADRIDCAGVFSVGASEHDGSLSLPRRAANRLYAGTEHRRRGN